MPNLVYIVWFSNYEDSEVAGVFFDKEKAIQKATELSKQYIGRYSIHEWNVAEQTFDWLEME